MRADEGHDGDRRRPPTPRLRRPSALVRSISPRNPRSARTWAVVALLVTVLTNLLTAVTTAGSPTVADAVAALGCTGLAAFLLVASPRRTAPFLVLVPLVGVATIVWLDLVTGDAGIPGQVFFTVPVVWAAAQLRVGGVALVTAATVAGEAVVVRALLPAEEAVTAFVYVTVLCLLISGVLTRAGALQERLVEQLRHQADVDPLTGLWTRRVLDRVTARAVRQRLAEAALVLIDLDRFKAVNDTYGHLGGDAALSHVAALLSAHCREADVVARMGGDELAVLMLDCPRETAARRAQQFVDVVGSTPLELPDGTLVPLSISAGLATLSPSATRVEDLYASADAALYVAKRAGRGRLSAA